MADTKNQTTVSISCVTFKSDEQILLATIHSLAESAQLARTSNKLQGITLDLIDNGPDLSNLSTLKKIQNQYQHCFDKVTILSGHGNIGYGRGHNLSISLANSTYHLVINPDVTVEPENLTLALEYMDKHSDVVLLAPNATDEHKNQLFLAKRRPKLHVLVARALKIGVLEKMFQKDMNLYEYRDILPTTTAQSIELASGCYMFCRCEALQMTGGFDQKYFMYFEDFDLSIRMSKIGKIIFLPDLKILHYGGNASRKGLRHLVYFSTSMLKFFYKHRFNFKR